MTVLIVLIILIAILLGVIVLIQNPKGGGLNSSFGGVGNQIFGAQRSTDVVEKATWYLAIAMFVLCLGSAWAAKSAAKKTLKTPSATSTAPTQSEVEKNFNNYKSNPNPNGFGGNKPAAPQQPK